MFCLRDVDVEQALPPCFVSPRQKPSLSSVPLRAPKTHLWEITIPLLGYFQHGKHGNFGITIRHILIIRIIALRWADVTEPACVYSHSPFLLRPSALSVPLFIEDANSKISASLRAPKKQFVLVHDMYRTHGFVEQRMTRNFRNFHPAHFDSTDHRFAMGGCYGACVRLLPFSIPPQAVGPLCPPLHRRCSTPKSLRLCVPPP